MLSELMDFMLRHGMPMEQITTIPSYREKNRQSRNAEEALIAALNGCARVTKVVSIINWPTEFSAKYLFSRLRFLELYNSSSPKSNRPVNISPN